MTVELGNWQNLVEKRAQQRIYVIFENNLHPKLNSGINQTTIYKLQTTINWTTTDEGSEGKQHVIGDLREDDLGYLMAEYVAGLCFFHVGKKKVLKLGI